MYAVRGAFRVRGEDADAGRLLESAQLLTLKAVVLFALTSRLSSEFPSHRGVARASTLAG